MLLFSYILLYVIINYLVFALLDTQNGLVDHFLSGVGMHPIDWYSSPQYWPVILTLVNLWKSGGLLSIVSLAGIIALNPEYYEPARIDWAPTPHTTRYIPLPLPKPFIIVNVLLVIGQTL